MRKFALVALLSTSTFVIGCATKNYVRETVAPVQTKVDQAADTNNKQDTEIAQDQKDIQKNATDISAIFESAAPWPATTVSPEGSTRTVSKTGKSGAAACAG